MNQEHPSECPVSGDQSIPPPPLEYHDTRWDLSEDADRLCPIPSEHAESLEQSAKLAWRNSVRCIGRRLWKGLDVIDARSLKEPDDIFEALLTHLRKATNGGKIIPVMTVFREWLSDAPEIRIWNHQLIRYAGYETTNGKRLGDPMNVELTRAEVVVFSGTLPGHFTMSGVRCPPSRGMAL
ncbi:nitric oxide synthase oxygenase [bacterium]|nr:nitric oxide synthase oxygenase [bacterium]